MSVIAAIVRADGAPLEPSLLGRVLEPGRPFGPDAEGMWVRGEVGLGARRLHLTEEESSALPLRDDRRDLVVAWDGRLDNRGDLLARLGSPSQQAAPSDEALVLDAYERWGTACLDHLIGDFAFVLWDGRTRRLLAARDHLGVRPLHYAFDGRSLFVASRIGQLLDGGGLGRRLNEGMLADYLAYNWNSSQETLFQDVQRVPPAHLMELNRGVPSIRRYWSARDRPAIRYRSDSDYVEHFRELFLQAVSSRLRSAHPVGMMLSGGLDSSAVACVASGMRNGSRPGNGRLPTFTAVFDELSEADERRYVEPLVARQGFHAHYVPADDLWTLRDESVPTGSWDEPFDGMFDGVVEGLLDRARDEGVRVLLTGHGGDMVVAGNSYYLFDLLIDFRWARLLRELRSCPRSARRRLVKKYVLAPLLGRGPEHEIDYYIPEWIRPEFAARTELESRLRAAPPPRRFRRPSRQLDFEAITAVETSVKLLWLQSEALRRGIELRHPFFDLRLIDFSMRIPAWRKLRDAVNKAIVRSAMEESFPAIIGQRFGSGGFKQVLDRGLRERERSRWEECLSNSRLAELGYVDPVPLRRAFARYVAGKDDDLRYGLALVYRLELWLKHVQWEAA